MSESPGSPNRLPREYYEYDSGLDDDAAMIRDLSDKELANFDNPNNILPVPIPVPVPPRQKIVYKYDFKEMYDIILNRFENKIQFVGQLDIIQTLDELISRIANQNHSLKELGLLVFHSFDLRNLSPRALIIGLKNRLLERVERKLMVKNKEEHCYFPVDTSAIVFTARKIDSAAKGLFYACFQKIMDRTTINWQLSQHRLFTLARSTDLSKQKDGYFRKKLKKEDICEDIKECMRKEIDGHVLLKNADFVLMKIPLQGCYPLTRMEFKCLKTDKAVFLNNYSGSKEMASKGKRSRGHAIDGPKKMKKKRKGYDFKNDISTFAQADLVSSLRGAAVDFEGDFFSYLVEEKQKELMIYGCRLGRPNLIIHREQGKLAIYLVDSVESSSNAIDYTHPVERMDPKKMNLLERQILETIKLLRDNRNHVVTLPRNIELLSEITNNIYPNMKFNFVPLNFKINPKGQEEFKSHVKNNFQENDAQIEIVSYFATYYPGFHLVGRAQGNMFKEMNGFSNTMGYTLGGADLHWPYASPFGFSEGDGELKRIHGKFRDVQKVYSEKYQRLYNHFYFHISIKTVKEACKEIETIMNLYFNGPKVELEKYQVFWCATCGEKLSINSFRELNQKKYCSSCFKCSICKKVIPKTEQGIYFKGVLRCFNCIHECNNIKVPKVSTMFKHT